MNAAPHLPPLLSDPGYPALKRYLLESTGLAYYAERDAELAARLARRMRETAARDCSAYLDLLRAGDGPGSELDVLVASLTIGETYFFREPEHFEALRTLVLPELLEKRRRHERIRIWSAGCATGPEPYSLAILLRRELRASLAGWEVEILGTDVNRQFLSRAREARFEPWALRGTPDEVRRACFRKDGGSYVLLPEYREGVSFQFHNLVKHPIPSLSDNLFGFDVILCRNVRIYFDPETSRRLVRRLREALAEGGWLIVGHAEHQLDLLEHFDAVSYGTATLYRRREEPAPGSPTLPQTSPSWATEPLESVDRAEPGSPFGPPDPSRSGPRTEPCGRVQEGADASDIAAIRRLADRGHLEEATALVRAAIEKDPLRAALHFYLGVFLSQLGQPLAAETALKKALYLDGEFVLAHYYLGLLRQKRGERRGARRSFENVLELVSSRQLFFDGVDGISGSDLRELATMHLELLAS